MNKTEKAEIVSEIREHLDKSTAIFLVDYHGVNVEDINNLRRQFRKEGVVYKVYKNTLFKKAIEEKGLDELNNHLVGMTGIVFAEDNFVAPAKIIQKYSGEKNKFTFKGCYIDSQFYGSDQLKQIASMPSKEEILSGIVGSIAAPASGIVGAIAAVMRDLVSVIDEISKKEAA